MKTQTRMLSAGAGILVMVFGWTFHQDLDSDPRSLANPPAARAEVVMEPAQDESASAIYFVKVELIDGLRFEGALLADKDPQWHYRDELSPEDLPEGRWILSVQCWGKDCSTLVTILRELDGDYNLQASHAYFFVKNAATGAYELNRISPAHWNLSLEKAVQMVSQG